MSKLVKLTGPRRALLKDLAEQRRPVHATYPPLVWLVAQGYVDGRKVGLGTTYQITEAGRSALRAEGDGE
ncbi:hypothetical protein [Methylobacterium currus]|uniref:hypothetical protein n=1 Tax=Methylobacterium currus TaxID=2051553 RepID=UPI000F4E45CF|nr:hypothetical protein [Methylobacterium currus]